MESSISIVFIIVIVLATFFSIFSVHISWGIPWSFSWRVSCCVSGSISVGVSRSVSCGISPSGPRLSGFSGLPCFPRFPCSVGLLPDSCDLSHQICKMILVVSTTFQRLLLVDLRSRMWCRRRVQVVIDLQMDCVLMGLTTSIGRQQRIDNTLASLTHRTKDLHRISKEYWLDGALLKLLHI